MEVKIGVQFGTRELVIESTESAEDIEKSVSAALAGKDRVLTLKDDKGRRLVVPVDKLAYVEIAEPDSRRVGFGRL